MRNVLVIPLLVLLLEGCVPSGSRSPRSANFEVSSPPTAPALPSAPAPQVEPPFIEITPEAVAQLKQIVKTKNVKDLWWLRITIKPGGCQGMRSFLDLDTAGTE